MTTKYKNILFASLIAMVILVTSSCVEQDPYQGAATISASSPSVTIQADDFQNIPGVEADGTYTYTITLSEPQVADVKFEIFQSGGTATAHEDFDLGESSIVIPAYETSAQGSLTIYADTDPEETETLQITIGDETTANVIYEPQVYDFILDNFESELLDITFNFDFGYINAGDTYFAYDWDLDMDFAVSPAADFDINDPWASALPYYGAATGDTPEVLTLDYKLLGDGEYVIWHNVYSNPYYIFWESIKYSVEAVFVRAGVFQHTVIQDPSQAMDGSLPGEADDDYEGTSAYGIVALLKIEGDKYIIKDYEGNELASGKMEAGKTRTLRPVELNKVVTSGTLSLEK